MSQLRTGSRLSHGGTRYLLETDPGAVVYRNGTSTTNLAMKEWTHALATNVTGAVTFTLPVGLFTTIQYISPVVIRDSADPTLATFAMVRSYSTTSIVIQCFESKTSGVLIGGVIEGLDVTSAAVAVMIKVTGV